MAIVAKVSWAWNPVNKRLGFHWKPPGANDHRIFFSWFTLVWAMRWMIGWMISFAIGEFDITRRWWGRISMKNGALNWVSASLLTPQKKSTVLLVSSPPPRCSIVLARNAGWGVLLGHPQGMICTPWKFQLDTKQLPQLKGMRSLYPKHHYGYLC